uniref:Uncharacterized protein n=1 Tax=Aegilops tauschii subsp. strangulata TaxID=200361 RepID=A0A453IF28_AEGTS
MDLTSGFLASSLGTVTVSTPFSMDAFTCSALALSGRRNLRRNLPLLRSTRCQVSVFSSCSFFRSPLIWRMLPSSTSTFTSSFFSPGTSALNTCASDVSFQSMRAPAKAAVSEEVRGTRLPLLLLPEPKGKPSNGSKKSREKGSNTLLRRISDIVCGDSSCWRKESTIWLVLEAEG